MTLNVMVTFILPFQETSYVPIKRGSRVVLMINGYAISSDFCLLISAILPYIYTVNIIREVRSYLNAYENLEVLLVLFK